MVVERLQKTRRQRRVIKWCLKHPHAPMPTEVVEGLQRYRAYPELEYSTLEDYWASFELPLFELRQRYERIMLKRVIRSDYNRNMIRREVEAYAASRKGGCPGIGGGH